jgi:Uma2 family endonuclease
MNIRPNIPEPDEERHQGVRRRLWTVGDLRRLEEAGILGHEERVELIAGEIVTMPPKGIRYEVVRNELVLLLADRRPKDVKFAEEPPLTLDGHYEPEPDIILFPAALKVHQVRGDSVLLVVEIADSSLEWDLDTKARTYAAFGVREYWVINANTLETTVHREPAQDGYSRVRTVAAGETLTPSKVPALSVRLADLPLQDL